MLLPLSTNFQRVVLKLGPGNLGPGPSPRNMGSIIPLNWTILLNSILDPSLKIDLSNHEYILVQWELSRFGGKSDATLVALHIFIPWTWTQV